MRGTTGTYPPIAEHGLIGDLHTAALVTTAGTVDWFCCPRFDSPSVFGAILDAEGGGSWTLRPDHEELETRQLYLPDTAVLITRFFDPDGVAELADFMPIPERRHPRRRLVRRVSCARGQITFVTRVAPAFDYGRTAHETVVADHGGCFRTGELSLTLSAPVDLRRDGDALHARFTLAAGEHLTFVLEEAVGDGLPEPVDLEAVERVYEQTVAYWRRWSSRSRYTGRWREMVHRSALTLKLLTYQPTGAIVAAPTTSLPEMLGGGRNWDYRYTWIRDAAFSVYALLRLGFTDEAQAFTDWLTERFSEDRPAAHGPLQVMYGIDGRTDLTELVLDHWEGYQGSGPVRIGNGAADQLQLDIYGELVDSLYLYNKYGTPLYAHAWDNLSKVVDWVAEHWDQADEGIWETRGGRQQFTYSRLMCWVAIERSMRVARQRGLPADLVRWGRARDEIYRRIMGPCWSDARGAFVQSERGAVLDASVLMMPLVKFIAPTDPRWLSTLDAIGTDLVSDSLVYRYDPSAAPDGLEGDEGTFTMCSFWYVEALARAGQLDAARLAFEKMLTYANHLGLYSEEIGPTGQLLGNFPQAFTHLALISAAFALDRALG